MLQHTHTYAQTYVQIHFCINVKTKKKIHNLLTDIKKINSFEILKTKKVSTIQLKFLAYESIRLFLCR